MVEAYCRTPGPQVVYWLVDDNAGDFEAAVADSDVTQLLSTLRSKASRYRQAASDNRMPLYIAVHSLPFTTISPSSILEGSSEVKAELEMFWEMNPHLAGIIFLDDIGDGELKLMLLKNPKCVLPVPPALNGCDCE